MGKVYRAEQAPLGRTCALKVLNPKYAGDHDPEFHKRFFLEASIASKLTHPNTVTIFDYGRTDDEVYYMAMEYLEGRTLHRAIREEGAFSEERVAHIARQVCRSLREAHSLGVIHRDLKPANIFLVEHADEHDFVKVLDFGLVKNVENPGEDLTQAGLFMGSPKYMAPEQIKGDKVDGRTDVYALGIIMYEMLTGKVPFDRPNSVHIMMAHVNEPPPPLRSINPDIQVSPSTEELIFKTLEKDPDLRYTSMEHLLNSLKVVGGGAMTATLSGVLSSGDFMAVTGSSGSNAIQSGSGPNQPMFLSPSGSSSQSGPLMAQQMESTDEGLYAGQRKGSKGVLAIAIAAVLVLGIAGVAFFATRESSSSTAPPAESTAAATETATAPPATDTASVSATPTVSATPKVATVKLDSTPAGATVKDSSGRQLCESTPCEIKFEGDDAADGKEHELTFERPGYREVTKMVRPTDKDVSVRLMARSGGGPVRPPPPTTGTTPPPGFKDIPY
jgi:serine/threonine-protein kinase